MAALLRAAGAAAVIVSLAAAASLLSVGSATTRYMNVPSTGYAFGSWGGATPWLGELTPEHFANHSSSWYPRDPASYWPYGTWIWDFSPAPMMFQGDGSVMFPTAFILKDIGDPYCQRGWYWVDLYFGRYRNPSDPCACGNATEFCYVSQNFVNNCQDALAWGVRSVAYSGPP